MTRVPPIEAVFLGLDPAKHTSGAVILVPDYGNGLAGEDPHPFDGRYYLQEYGKVLTQPERGRFVESFVNTAIELELPAIVIAETWDPPITRRVRGADHQYYIVHDQKWNFDTILGMGEGWGLWEAELLNAGEWLEEDGLPPLIVHQETPNSWSEQFFGTGRAKRSEARKAAAVRAFEQLFGFAASEDISEAGCLAMVGTVSPVVAQLVQAWPGFEPPAPKPKPKRRAAAKPKPKTRSRKKKR